MRKNAYLPQRSLKHAAPFITCVIYTVLNKYLSSIWLYCDVSPSPVYTSLSVSIVNMHATFMTFIIHTYLHHLCILAFFNVCFEIICSRYIYPKGKKKKKKEE